MQLCITRRTFLLLGVSQVLLCSISCGSKRKLYPVRGKVLLDGQPTEGAMVTLIAEDTSDPMEVAPRAYVQADGSFTIGTFAPEDGAPPGEYRITVIWLPPNAREVMAATGKTPSKIPLHYSFPKDSGLRGTVKAEPNEWPPFQLTAKK